jgi:phage gp29-like protein
MSHKGIVAISGQNASIDPQSVGNQSGTIHMDHVNMVDTHYAMLVLGQLGSSEGEKGRLGNNQSQEDVRQDKRETDCHGIEETVQREIVVPMWMAWNGGDGKDAPQFRLRSLRTRQLQEIADASRAFSDAGHKADRTFLQMETGMPFTDPDTQAEKAKEPEGTVPPSGSPANAPAAAPDAAAKPKATRKPKAPAKAKETATNAA